MMYNEGNVIIREVGRSLYKIKTPISWAVIQGKLTHANRARNVMPS